MSTEKTITVKYKAGHSYDESWAHEPALFCPHCGKQTVWVEQSSGDYYVGQQHLCLSCRWTFYIPTLSEGHDEYDEQRIMQLTE